MEEWLSSPLGIIAALAVAGFIGGIGRLIWQASRWVQGVDNNLKRVDDDRSLLQSFMAEIRDDIKKVFLRLPTPVAQSASPSVLTDYGNKIAETFDAAAWAKEIAETIVGRITGMAAFEIDEFCQKYVDAELDDTQKTKVLKVAYEFGIEHQKVRNVLRIVLRDELLKHL